MPVTEPTLRDLLPMLLIAGASVGVCMWRGWLWPGGLKGVPYRDAGLRVFDVFIGMMVLLVGMVLVGPVLVGLGLMLPMGATEHELQLTTSQEAIRALLIQGMTLLPVMVYVLARSHRHAGGWDQLGLSGRRGGWLVLSGSLGLLLGTPIVMAVLGLTSWFGYTVLHQPMPELGHQMLEAIREADDLAGTIGLILAAVVVAPLVEEVVFRGLVQTALLEVELARIHRWSVILISATVFTLLHVGMPWQTLPGLWVLGVALGWMYERTGNLWPCIFTHAGFNALNIMMVVFFMGE